MTISFNVLFAKLEMNTQHRCKKSKTLFCRHDKNILSKFLCDS